MRLTRHDKRVAIAELESQLALALLVVAQQKVAGGAEGCRACRRTGLDLK